MDDEVPYRRRSTIDVDLTDVGAVTVDAKKKFVVVKGSGVSPIDYEFFAALIDRDDHFLALFGCVDHLPMRKIYMAVSAV